MIRRFLAAALPAALLVSPMAIAAQHDSAEGEMSSESGGDPTEGYTMIARAPVMNADDTEIGTVSINETLSGQMLVILALSDLPEGAHGVHIHETGDCSADDFSSAGGHLAGDADHGVMAENGPHPGDLPNIVVGSEGAANVEYFNTLLTADLLFDDDGAAFIVHENADDYMSQPSGDAGGRLACGVFEDTREG